MQQKDHIRNLSLGGVGLDHKERIMPGLYEYVKYMLGI